MLNVSEFFRNGGMIIKESPIVKRKIPDIRPVSTGTKDRIE